MKKLLFVASLLAVGACGKSKWEKALSEFEDLKDRMCKCEDKACAEKVENDVDAWKTDMRKSMSKDDRPPKDLDEKGRKLKDEMRECERKIAK